MFGWLAKALAFFYDVWPSYGGSIVLLTLAIMIVLLPLTLKGTRSMIEMQRLQPEMKKLQNRYKDDRQKLNEELLKFYKENNINPLGGCLPLLIQLPVFWVLYRVLEGLTKRAPFGFDIGAGVATGNHAFEQAGFFHPAYISHSSSLYQNLSHSREMVSWGIDLSQSVTSAFTHGLVHALPYILLLIVVIATTYIQQWQIQSRAAAEANPQQQMLMRFMPLFFAVIYIVIPAGVVVYFLASNLFRIGQQYLITRTMYATPAGGAIPATAKETAPRRTWRSILAPGTETATSGRGSSSKRQSGGAQRQKPRQAAQRSGGKSPARASGGSRPGPGGGAKRASAKAPRRASDDDAKDAADVDGAVKSGARRAGNPSDRGSRATSKTGTGRNSRASQQRRQQRRAAPEADVDEVVTRPAPNGRSKSPSRKSPPPPNRARSKRKRK